MNIIPPKKTEVKHEGEMVVEGVQCDCDDDHSGAVSRKTRTRCLIRKARRDALAEQQDQQELEENDVSSEQSKSSVACITGDYAMQYLILQMGLRLLAPGGMQIRQLKRWIRKCHACYTVTTSDIFCPNCGNGGTLRKVAGSGGPTEGLGWAGASP